MKVSTESPIVMVDDDDIDIYFIKRSLVNSSITNPFLPFHSGPSFLEYMEQVRLGNQAMPKVVLLDINMPRMDGYQLYGILRGYREFKYLPSIIFYSHSDDPHDRDLVKEIQASFQEKFSNRNAAVEFLESLL